MLQQIKLNLTVITNFQLKAANDDYAAMFGELNAEEQRILASVINSTAICLIKQRGVK